jgi:hypothetical protein
MGRPAGTLCSRLHPDPANALGIHSDHIRWNGLVGGGDLGPVEFLVEFVHNRGAIPKDLLEAGLFAHVKGSFTGASADKLGKIELAHSGSLFLDEMGEMPLELQVKVLRLIQRGKSTNRCDATDPR